MRVHIHPRSAREKPTRRPRRQDPIYTHRSLARSSPEESIADRMSVAQATRPDRSIPCTQLAGAMPCLAHHHHHPRPPAANHCKSLSCLIRETYAHCHVPCLRMPGARWSSDDDSDDDDDDVLDTKQVILDEIRNRQLRKESRCSVDSPALSSAFIWFFTPLDPRSVLEKVSSPEKCVVVGLEKEEVEAGIKGEGEEKEEVEAGSDAGDVQSEAFFSVKSFFTRSTSRAATVASLTDMDPPETWDGFRNCAGWPFGLCRRPAVPPLPSTPADSWKWRKQSSGRNLAASPRPAHSHNKITTS